MLSLKNKNILVGVTGGIAAYKSAELVRSFVTQGAQVRVILTEAAQAFITPLTLQALSGNPVHTELISLEAEAGMGHIELARWADMIVVAPCSADFMSKLVMGEASDLLSTVYLANNAIKVIAPAMNQVMWSAPATQVNLKHLQSRDERIIGPASGQQACGDVGLGRMEEPQVIARFCANQFETGSLSGKRVLITAGPTREAIDPVRYLSNHSSGKMGYALAEAARDAGAQVTLISGPVSIQQPDDIETIQVESACDMFDAVMSKGESTDIFIGAAAVADYRIENIATEKLKKDMAFQKTLNLVENPDIIRSFKSKFDSVFTVGFAAETQNVVAYAKTKLEKKKLDLIIANDVSDSRIGFNSEDNAVVVVSKDEDITLKQQQKLKLARKLITLIAKKS